MINAKSSDWLKQKLSKYKAVIMDVSAFIEDFAENAISIIEFEEMSASKNRSKLMRTQWYYNIIGAWPQTGPVILLYL